MNNDTVPPEADPGMEPPAADVAASDGPQPVAQPRYVAQQPVPYHRWPCTLITIVLAVLFSAARLTGRDVDFAYADEHIWDGHWWRFITSCLLHADILHLAFNIYWLAELGRPIELRLGSIRTALLFVLLGLGSSAAEFLLDGNGGIGLSGVGYGCFGLLWAVRQSPQWSAYVLPHRVIKVFVGWFFLCIVMTIANRMAVANAAHAAGFVLGFAAGRAMLSGQPRRWLSVTVAVTGLVTLSTLYMPWTYHWWWQKAYAASVRNDTGRSLTCAREAVRLAGDDSLVAPLLVHIASIYIERREFDQAITWQQRAARVSSEPGTDRALTAYMYWLKGDKNKAAAIARLIANQDVDTVSDDPDFLGFVRQVRNNPELTFPPTTSIDD